MVDKKFNSRFLHRDVVFAAIEADPEQEHWVI